jgi:hypothetical protein
MRPNFIIIGAGRAGTTSLHHYLRQIPQIFMSPVKETNFFAFEEGVSDVEAEIRPIAGNLFPIRRMEDYLALFAEAGDAVAVGEASPLYMFSPGAAKRMKDALPEVRIIAVLRNPVDRAHSSHLKYVRDGVEPRTLSEAIREERSSVGPRSLFGPYNYLRAGYHARNLVPYLESFPRDRIALFLFEDFARDTEATLRQILDFLDVGTAFVPDCSVRHNASGIPRSRTLHRLLDRSRPAKWAKDRFAKSGTSPLTSLAVKLRNTNLKRPPLSPSLRGELADLYREDVTALQSIVGRDLTHWLR